MSMGKALKILLPAAAAVVAAAGTPAVWAQATGQITYAPLAAGGVSAVPTLGEWTLIALTLALMGVAWRVLRGRVGAHLLAPLLLLGGLLTVSGFNVSGWLQPAQAAAEYDEAVLSNAAGGVATVQQGLTQVTNTSGVALKITKLEVMEGEEEGGMPDFLDPDEPYVPQCKVGTQLSPDGVCWVWLERPV